MKKQGLAILSVATLFVLSGCSNTSLNVPRNKSNVTSAPAQEPVNENQKIQSLLAQYGWHESGSASSVWDTQLPKSYKLQPGHVPIGLYWGYHNTLSKTAGLDMTPYLGQRVKVWAIPLQENWKIGPPPESTYAIVITDSGKLIGAWISKGQEDHIVDICESLNHQEFADITEQTWGNWVVHQNIVDYRDSFYSKMHQWTPKQLLQAYYSEINDHQYDSAYAMMSTFAQYQLMTMNVPVGHLYNAQWDPQGGGLSNWKTAKFVGMKSYHTFAPKQNNVTAESRLYNNQNETSMNYTVTFDATVRKVIAMNNGRNTYFTTIIRESSEAPWTIGGFGTGP